MALSGRTRVDRPLNSCAQLQDLVDHALLLLLAALWPTVLVRGCSCFCAPLRPKRAALSLFLLPPKLLLATLTAQQHSRLCLSEPDEMRSVLVSLSALAALVQLSAAAAVPYRRWNDAKPGDVTTDPLPPTQDPFYNVPSDVASKQNGDVLKSRPVWTEFDAYSRGTYQLLYRTTNATGGATAAVTTVFAPLKPANPPRINLLMSEYAPAHPFSRPSWFYDSADIRMCTAPIDSACPNCEPAFALQSGSGSNGTSFIVPEIALDIVASLSKGWYVTVPDHDGLNAAFFAGVVEAFAGIDGLRALLNFATVLPCADNYAAALRGYSGGAHAAAWVNEYLQSYGKGLNVSRFRVFFATETSSTSFGPRTSC